MARHVFINAEKTELLVFDDQSEEVQSYEGVAEFEDDEEREEAPAMKTPKASGVRRCGQCGKPGHRKDACANFIRETRPTLSKEELKKKLEPKAGERDEWYLHFTFEEADKIVEDSDGIKGEALVALAKEHGITIGQMYNLRSRVRARWSEENGAKRYEGKPAEPKDEDEVEDNDSSDPSL